MSETSNPSAALERPIPKRPLVIIPTFNEAENIGLIVGRVREAVPEAHVLVVDDNSPDGTGQLADSFAARDDQVHVLHRTAKNGLGAAYLAGFDWGLNHPNHYDAFIEMDADGSHQPEQLPSLLRGSQHADVVLGSRWVPGGSVVNWPAHRLLISRGGSLYTRLALGVPIRDVTGGYRVYSREALETLALQDVESQGYCFQVDMVWRSVQAGLTVAEVPITFVERERGQSKMNQKIVLEALTRVSQWGAQARMEQVKGFFGRKKTPSSS